MTEDALEWRKMSSRGVEEDVMGGWWSVIDFAAKKEEKGRRAGGTVISTGCEVVKKIQKQRSSETSTLQMYFPEISAVQF